MSFISRCPKKIGPRPRPQPQMWVLWNMIKIFWTLYVRKCGICDKSTHPPPLSFFTVFRESHSFKGSVISVEQFVWYWKCWPEILQIFCIANTCHHVRKSEVRTTLHFCLVIIPGMSFTVLVARVPDDLPGEGEQLVPPGQHGGHQAADLGGRLVYRNLEFEK